MLYNTYEAKLAFLSFHQWKIEVEMDEKLEQWGWSICVLPTHCSATIIESGCGR